MASEAEIAWAAGIFEGEGCITTNNSGRGRRRYVQLVIVMTDEDTVRRFHEIVGVGFVFERSGKTRKHKAQWRWTCGARPEVEHLLKLFRPWLSARRKARTDELLAEIPRPRVYRKRTTIEA